MPFTLVAWQESIDEDDVLSNVAAVADQHIHVEGDRIFVPELNKLLAEYVAQANGMYAARIQSPSLRAGLLIDIPILQQGLNPSGSESFYPHFDCPISLVTNEGLEALANKPADGSVVATILAWLADADLKPVYGEFLTVRFTATITSVLGEWKNGAITLAQTLPVGKYAIVGANVIETGGDAIAFRFVIPGYPWRPGGLSCNSYGAKPFYLQMYGGMGVWAEFDSQTPPTIEILHGAAASQSLVGYLNLVKTG